MKAAHKHVRTGIIIGGLVLSVAIALSLQGRPAAALAREVLGFPVISALFLAALLAVEANRLRILRELRASARTLRASEQRFRGVFEEAAVGIAVLDCNGRFLSVNKAVTEITQYTAAELVGQDLSWLMAADQTNGQKNLSAERAARIAAGNLRAYRVERCIRRKDGQSAWVRASVSVLSKGESRDGALCEITVLAEDITEQKRIREQLALQATHDSLTGLANRRHFENTLQSAVEAAARDGSELVLLYVDLDGFKTVNDSLGHTAGDILLREVAERMRRSLGPAEFLARIGGDEFAVVKPFGPDAEDVPGDAAALAKRLIESVAKPFSVRGNDVQIGASVGICRFPADESNPEALLQGADTAMYHAKRYGQVGFCFFDAHLRTTLQRKLSVEAALRKALDRGEFHVYYQPLYDLSNDTLIRFEALCRWRSAELGDVSPAEFIPVAEDVGLICDLGRWVLAQACTEAQQWRDLVGAVVHIAVNVSALQFAGPDFVESVQEILWKTGFPPHMLELELTESTIVIEREDSIRKMERLRELGVAISIDDFGTGYSSLSYLHTMPIDALKIDRSFTLRLARPTEPSR